MKFLKVIFRFLNLPFFKYGIFWAWNFIFLILLIYGEIEGNLLLSIVKNAFVGYTPFDLAMYGLIIFLLPIPVVVLGIKLTKEGRSHDLLKLFYGVEIPLWILFILRVFLIREMTIPVWHLFLLLALGILSYLTEIFVKNDESPHWLKVVQKVGHSLLLMIGVYISVLIIFYSIPIIGAVVQAFFEFDWLDIDFRDIFMIGFFGFLWVIFMMLTGTLFVLLPIAMVWLYSRAFLDTYKINIPFGKLMMWGTIGVNIGLFVLLSYSQPQTKAFEILEKDFSKVENRELFFEHQDEIKEGLLNAYLSSYRYLGSDEDNNSLSFIYDEVFGLDENSGASKFIQGSFNFIMSPFLYQGSIYSAESKAARLYEKYFDGSIQKLEQKPVSRAIESTWDNDGIEAGLLNINQQKVLIEKQEITIDEQGDMAEIEVYETYKNQTFRRQEIFYYFSLPPNSVITGLWLSDADSVAKKYDFRVSPRGAAQKIYKQEVQRRVDPSLLEQVGDNQYRLRAFPIEPKRKEYNGTRYRRNSFEVKDGQTCHLWFSYKTLINENYEWLFPQLAQKRNVYWNNDTKLIINGKEMEKRDSWLPASMSGTKRIQAQSHTANLNNNLKVAMNPTQLDNNASFANKKVALLIDGSYSMSRELDNLANTLSQFGQAEFDPKNISCFVINDQVEQIGFAQLQKDARNFRNTFFGTGNNLKIMERFAVKADPKNYDILVLLTDQGNYESINDSTKAIPLGRPLYLMHVSEGKSPIYADAFIETVHNSKGRFVDDFEDLLDQIKVQSMNNDNVVAYQDGMLYTQLADSVPADDDNYSAIASKYFIESLKVKSDTGRLSQLDEVHQIALREKIVTSFSSMIVLVNDRQKKALDEAEKEKDRFDRKVEGGSEETSKPMNPFQVSGTPEPHEWILMILIGALLLVHWYRKRMEVKSNI